MTPEDVITELRQQLRARNDDNEELKLDKRDLRAHIAKLKEELDVATKALQDELQETRAELKAVKTENERLRGTVNRDPKRASDGGGGSSFTQGTDKAASDLTRKDPHQELPTSSRTIVSHVQKIKERSPSVEIVDPPPGYTSPQRKEKRKNSGENSLQGSNRLGRTVTVTSPPLHSNSGTGTLVVPDHVRSRPKVKVTVDRALDLPIDVLVAFLKDTPPLQFKSPPSTLLVSRQLLHTAYGCSPRQNIQYIHPSKNPSGRRLRVLVLPRYDIHPSIPLLPGHSGLIMTGRYSPPQGSGPYSLFRKDLRGSPTWLYLGEYEWRTVGKMSAAAFRGQVEAVKQGLASEIVAPKKNTSDYYLRLRARIALRKEGLLPTNNKAIEQEVIRQELLSLNAGRPLDLSEEDVISSLSRGEESIDLILIRCVSYDRVFAKDIEAKWLASKRRGKNRVIQGSSSTVQRWASPYMRARQAASSVQPGTYTSGASAALRRHAAHNPGSSDQIKGTKQTWSPSAGQRVLKTDGDSMFSGAAQASDRGVVDSAQDGVNPKDIFNEEDVVMGDLDDGYLSYASEEAFDPSYMSG